MLLAGCKGATAHIERGDELMRSQLYEQARDEYQKATKLDPENPEAASRLAKVRKALAAQANDEGKQLMEMKDHLGAVAAFKRAVQLHSEEAAYIQGLKKATQAQLDIARKAIDEKKYARALAEVDKLLEHLPRHREAKRVKSEAELAWADQLYNQASDFQKRGLHGNALVLLVRLRKLVGTYRDSAALEVVARDQMRDAARFGVRIEAARVSRPLRDLNREVVHRLQMIEVKQCPTAKLPARADERLVLVVATREVDFKQAREISTGQQKFQSGIRKVDNPKYLELEQNITNHRIRIAELQELLKQDDLVIEQCRQAFADAGPSDDENALRKRLLEVEKKRDAHRQELGRKEEELVAFRNRLSKTPRMLDEPVYDTFTYEIYDTTRTAKVRIDLEAFGEGRVKLTHDTIEGNASTSDKTNPADPEHNVKADPLTFPESDEVLQDKALKDAVGKIAERIADLCQRWQAEILARARQASAAAAVEAVEDYVLYVFAVPGKPPKEVTDFLRRECDFSDVKALRGE